MKKYKGPGGAKTTLKKKNKAKGLTFSTSRLTIKLWEQDSWQRYTNGLGELKRDPHTHMDHCIFQ